MGARDWVLALTVGTPGSIRAKASVSSHHFWGGGRGRCLCCVSVSLWGWAQQPRDIFIPFADNVGSHR